MIVILMADGYEDIEALCPYDLLLRAGLDARLVGVTGKTVRGKACGSVMECAMTAKELIESGENIEMLVLPGGMPGAANLDSSAKTDEIIKITEKCGGYFAAICAAPMIYGKRKMLVGKKATAFPVFEQYLEGAEISDEILVRDGRFITAAGMGAALPFGLELVAALTNRETADKLAVSVRAVKQL